MVTVHPVVTQNSCLKYCRNLQWGELTITLAKQSTFVVPQDIAKAQKEDRHCTRHSGDTARKNTKLRQMELHEMSPGTRAYGPNKICYSCIKMSLICSTFQLGL